MNMFGKFLAMRSVRVVASACAATLVAMAQAAITISTPLMAGQHYVAGTVACSMSGDEINGQCVYTMTPGSDWCISEAHLWVGLTTPTKAAPGLFPFGASTSCASSLIVPFNLRKIGAPTCTEGAPGYVFAAHAVLHSRTYGTQTGWGYGPELPVNGGGWSMAFAATCAKGSN